jgi:hypothetical protein
MKREQYDFLIPPDLPKEVKHIMYYFPHRTESSLALVPRGPAQNELPCMAAHYDKNRTLLFTRFIFKDGTYKDEKA